MNAADSAGWACTFLVLSAYTLTVLGVPTIWFHRANAVAWLGIGASAISHGAWPSLVVTAAFGAIGILGLVRRPAASRPSEET